MGTWIVACYSWRFPRGFSECNKLLKILVMTSASSCSCERSFSALKRAGAREQGGRAAWKTFLRTCKRVKSFVRSTMSDERLSNLSFLSIEKEMISGWKKSPRFYDDVIELFTFSNRRIDFNYRSILHTCFVFSIIIKTDKFLDSLAYNTCSCLKKNKRGIKR